MAEVALTSYDELPYSCHPLHLTHPNHLATRAMFYGLSPPDVAQCRVLELGCGNGTNVMSLAQVLPKASFVGIDYAARQIEHGRRTLAEVGLKNVELRAASFTDVDESFGTFDYILCHGVYSWVSPENQSRILQIIRQHLATNGVAYVSYNVYPGWHLRGMVRDMLLYQVRGLSDPVEKVARARAYLDFLIQSQVNPETAYVHVLKSEQRTLQRAPDTYLFHEHLEEVNQPLYFTQFVERAVHHELQYLDEVRFHADLANLSPEVKTKLEMLRPQRIEYEQQIDFLFNGTFRRSLLCHREARLADEPSAAALQRMHLSSRARPVNDSVNLAADVPEQFKAPDDATITSTHPLVKAALMSLAEAAPGTMTLADVYHVAGRHLGQKLHGADGLELLAHAIFQLHQCQLVDVHLAAPRCAKAASDRPRTTPLTLWQATHDEPISNLHHCGVELTEFERYLLSLLDGTRTRADLHAILAGQIKSGVITLEKQGQSIHAPEISESVIDSTIERSLQKFAGVFLLCDD